MSERDDVEDNVRGLTQSSKQRLNDWAEENGINPGWREWQTIESAWNRQQEIIDTYQKIFNALAPELNPSLFVCGHSSITTTDGLPKYLYVCPAFGSDIVVAYKKKR